MIVLIDNGHGSDTSGKFSPPVENESGIGTIGVLKGADGHHRLREYYYSRLVANNLPQFLKQKGIDARLLVSEQTDIRLGKRVERVNKICRSTTQDVIVVSIHLDACPPADGAWHVPGGDADKRWSIRVSLNASKKSKKLAEHIADAAEQNGVGVRKPMPKQKYWPQNLAICRDTICPAVLVEGKFQDNIDDVRWLTSEKGFQTTVKIYLDGITSYIKSCQ